MINNTLNLKKSNTQLEIFQFPTNHQLNLLISRNQKNKNNSKRRKVKDWVS